MFSIDQISNEYRNKGKDDDATIKLVGTLIEYGAEINAEDNNKITSLNYAIDNRNYLIDITVAKYFHLLSIQRREFAALRTLLKTCVQR